MILLVHLNRYSLSQRLRRLAFVVPFVVPFKRGECRGVEGSPEVAMVKTGTLEKMTVMDSCLLVSRLLRMVAERILPLENSAFSAAHSSRKLVCAGES